MKELRIHFFTSFCHPAGTYFRFHNLAVGLSRLGHEVTVFALDADPHARARAEIRDGARYQLTPEWPGARLFGAGCHPASTLRRALRAYPPADVAHLFQPFPSGALAWRAASRGARARFFDWDDLWIGGAFNGAAASLRDRWMRAAVAGLERRLPAAADHVTTCSADLAALATERGAAGATVVWNGFWPASVPGRGEARERLGLDPDAHYVGFMGRTLRELDWCFAALEMSASRYPRLRLALCGMPPSALAAMTPEVRARSDYLGELTQVLIPVFAAAIDLGLLPLDDTPFNRCRFPIKFAEYLGSGAPVLLSAVGDCARLSEGMPWVLPAGRGRSAWLSAFEAAAERLANGRLPAVDVGAVERLLSWGHSAGVLAASYRAVLAGPGPGSH